MRTRKQDEHSSTANCENVEKATHIHICDKLSSRRKCQMPILPKWTFSFANYLFNSIVSKIEHSHSHTHTLYRNYQEPSSMCDDTHTRAAHQQCRVHRNRRSFSKSKMSAENNSDDWKIRPRRIDNTNRKVEKANTIFSRKIENWIIDIVCSHRVVNTVNFRISFCWDCQYHTSCDDIFISRRTHHYEMSSNFHTRERKEVKIVKLKCFVTFKVHQPSICVCVCVSVCLRPRRSENGKCHRRDAVSINNHNHTNNNPPHQFQLVFIKHSALCHLLSVRRYAASESLQWKLFSP